jgi:glycosyltransferase involved in cell wall biosynthesis
VVDPASGWVTGPDPAALPRALDEAAANDAEIAARGAAARERHAKLFSPAATTAALLDIYREAIEGAERPGDRAG